VSHHNPGDEDAASLWNIILVQPPDISANPRRFYSS